MSVESNFAIALVLVASLFATVWVKNLDWLKNHAPLSRPIKSKTKTSRDLPARVFPCLAPASSSDWFIGLFTIVVIGQSNYFGFGFTTLK